MGTRGLWGFVADGVEKLSYNHFDSYPSGLGQDVLRMAWRLSESPHLAEKVRAIELFDESVKPTPEQIEKYKAYANTSVDDGKLDNWYVLLRELQGEPDKVLEAGIMSDDRTFAADSLFCEWAYVIDLDGGNFEVYEGFQHAAHTDGRFAAMPRRERSDEYFPVRLVASWSLSALPTPQQFETWSELRSEELEEAEA